MEWKAFMLPLVSRWGKTSGNSHSSSSSSGDGVQVSRDAATATLSSSPSSSFGRDTGDDDGHRHHHHRHRSQQQQHDRVVEEDEAVMDGRLFDMLDPDCTGIVTETEFKTLLACLPVIAPTRGTKHARGGFSPRF